MSENNNNTITRESEAAPAAKKSNGGLWAGLICIILGIIIALVGYIMLRNTDTSKYYKFKDYTNSFSSQSVKDLDLDIEWADLIVEKSPDDDIHIDAKDVPEKFEASVSGSTFKIDFGSARVNFIPFSTFLSNNDVDPVITLQLPDKEFGEFKLDLGAGDNKITGISCSDLIIKCGAGEVNLSQAECRTCDIDCGAGEFNITAMNCENKLDIDGGAGEINIMDSILGGLDLDQGVGEFSFRGTINGDIDADGGVGELVFNLTNPESDFSGSGSKYKLDIDTGIGSKTVNYNVSD
ncbi:DUF4097 family beta strand repeat-containing protein [uncultured Ruminococcus sp.]|uniref:DUF4097 family beta strand repeat-containing protein n=1 Tax=uncultured Ruminococcus sp. TaxID=165186 RepID=UPI00260EDA37|nr:DUF4097 family beta strand repeat-containing protein [uncultured Ruminococcus sp.]